jgi:adenine-specific DNA methylase
VLGVAYLGVRNWPKFTALSSICNPTEATIEKLHRAFLATAKKDAGQTFPVDQVEQIWKQLKSYSRVIGYLNELPEVSGGYITQYFTQWGSDSKFLSARGKKGKRNYISRENAGRLDNILLMLRGWWNEGMLLEEELYLILASVLEEVTILANVNGTFHDFNRDKLWPNALQSLHLRVPLIAPSVRSAQIRCADALAVGNHLPSHDVLYLDPPYNFRQYSAYYHLLNFVAAYPLLPDLQSYLSNLEFVRGQNMDDDFTSEFCFRDKFVAALGELIDSMPCKYVCMSYYGGRNHWNHWSKEDELTDKGVRLLGDFFGDVDRFRGCEVFPALQVRRNYQSRVGEQKSLVDEHFFFAEKRSRPKIAQSRDDDPVSKINDKLGLDKFGQYNTGRFHNLSSRFPAGSVCVA